MIRFILVINLLLFANILHAMKIVEGSLDSLKFETTVINVTIDMSNISQEKFLSQGVSIIEFEKTYLPQLRDDFINNLNGKVTECSFRFNDGIENAKYELIVIPQDDGHNKYVIIDKKNNERMAVMTSNRTLNWSASIKVLKNVFEDEGDDLGDLVNDKTKLNYDDRVLVIDRFINTLKPFYSTNDGILKYVRVIESSTVQDKDSLFDICHEVISKAYVNSKEVIQVMNKQKGSIIGKGLFHFKGFMTNWKTYGEVTCPHTIKIDAKEGRVRITFEINYINRLDRLTPQSSILLQYPFNNVGNSKDNYYSYKSCIEFVFTGILDIQQQFEDALKINKEDDW